MEKEIIAQYSLDLGYELKDEDVFDKNRNIHDHLPTVGIKIGYDMGGRNVVVERIMIPCQVTVSMSGF